MKIISVPECVYSDALSHELNGKREIKTPVGRIDILTCSEVIEVKHVSVWKAAVGQAILYSAYYPQHGKRIHLFGNVEFNQKELIEIACIKIGVRVTWAKPIFEGSKVAEEPTIEIPAEVSNKATLVVHDLQEKILGLLRHYWAEPLSAEDLLSLMEINESQKRSLYRAIDKLIKRELIGTIQETSISLRGRPTSKYHLIVKKIIGEK